MSNELFNNNEEVNVLEVFDEAVASVGITQEQAANHVVNITIPAGVYTAVIDTNSEYGIRHGESEREIEINGNIVTVKKKNLFLRVNLIRNEEGKEVNYNYGLGMFLTTEIAGEALDQNNALHKDLYVKNMDSQARFRKDLLDIYGLTKKDMDARDPNWNISTLIQEVDRKEFVLELKVKENPNNNFVNYTANFKHPMAKTVIANEGTL